MNIEINKISTDFKGERCYVHARGLILPDGNGVMTLQKLELSGCDVFYGIEMMKTNDGGKSFSKPELCENLKRKYYDDGTSLVMCDATPFYHTATGKTIITGHMAWYGSNNALLREPRPQSPLYAVYNESEGTFGSFQMIEMPKSDEYFISGVGCSQILELKNGDLLIPIYYMSRKELSKPNACSTVAVIRCFFDGETVRFLEIGNSLTTDVPRGFCEPSIIQYRDEYFMCLRNDATGYLSKSRDGLHYDTPIELCFDNGENLGNYNTQQHWLTGGGRLWLVYNRRAENNGHMFRHRAPLFIAEVDPVTMRVKRDTEKIAVLERGARLGNFGCQSFSDEIGYIFAAEWMQNDPYGWEHCVLRGSDNSIFVSKVIF